MREISGMKGKKDSLVYCNNKDGYYSVFPLGSSFYHLKAREPLVKFFCLPFCPLLLIIQGFLIAKRLLLFVPDRHTDKLFAHKYLSFFATFSVHFTNEPTHLN